MMIEDYEDVGMEHYEKEDYNLFEDEQVFWDQYCLDDERTTMTIWIAVVQNNPGLSNAFTTQDEADRWIRSYIRNPVVTGGCHYTGYGTEGNPAGQGDQRAWLISREVQL